VVAAEFLLDYLRKVSLGAILDLPCLAFFFIF
jgi:hypothetical protein